MALKRSTAAAAMAVAIAVNVAPSIAAQAPSSSPRKLQLTFDADKRVTLAAENVTIQEIMAEWARRCGCYVVNANRLTGAPLSVPIQFQQASQSEVLESLLRQAAGYVLTPSRSASGVSNYETIYVLATSNASAVPTYSNPFSAPLAVPLATTGAPDDEILPVVPAAAGQPQQPAPAVPRPTAPGVSVPMTTVTPFGSTPAPAPAPGPSQGSGRGGAPPAPR